MVFMHYFCGNEEPYTVTKYSEYLSMMCSVHGQGEVVDCFGDVHLDPMDAQTFIDEYGEEFDDDKHKDKEAQYRCPLCHAKGTMLKDKRNSYFCGSCGVYTTKGELERNSYRMRAHNTRNTVTDAAPRKDMFRRSDTVDAGIVRPLLENTLGTDYDPKSVSKERALRI